MLGVFYCSEKGQAIPRNGPAGAYHGRHRQTVGEAARLINSYCTDEAKAELLLELRELADGYKALCGMYRETEEALPADSPQRRHWRAQFNKTEDLRRRMEGNIRLISGGREG